LGVLESVDARDALPVPPEPKMRSLQRIAEHVAVEDRIA
jgi:hypothetical protein